jgi:hypothetical protein
LSATTSIADELTGHPRVAAEPGFAVNRASFSKLMGFSLGRWCRRNARLIATRLGFAAVVEYVHDAWYDRDDQSCTSPIEDE